MKTAIFSSTLLTLLFSANALACSCKDLAVKYGCGAGGNLVNCNDGGQLYCHYDCGWPGLKSDEGDDQVAEGRNLSEKEILIRLSELGRNNTNL